MELFTISRVPWSWLIEQFRNCEFWLTFYLHIRHSTCWWLFFFFFLFETLTNWTVFSTILRWFRINLVLRPWKKKIDQSIFFIFIYTRGNTVAPSNTITYNTMALFAFHSSLMTMQISRRWLSLISQQIAFNPDYINLFPSIKSRQLPGDYW